MQAAAAAAAPPFSRGDKLRLCAPASSGLPRNATAIVASAASTDAGWVFDVTLTGGGPTGSDVRHVRGVSADWLRRENVIATAKSCAARPWGVWVRGAPRLLVPLFQRRYCWGAEQQARLWRDVTSLGATGPGPAGLSHGLGRVVVQRSRARPADAVVLDGQQRTITLTLLLAAVRDAAIAADAAAAAPLARRIDGVLLRPRTGGPCVGEADCAAARCAWQE